MSFQGLGKLSAFAFSSLQKHKSIIFNIFWVLISLVVLFFRLPDTILDAQFWAEDGRVWYSDAYNLGWRAFLIPQDGYFQTFSRLVGWVAQFVPLRYGPVIFNLAALAIQIIPSALIVSNRFEKIIPKLWVRVLLASSYLVIPNVAEIHGNLTNSQWFLALIACMILLSEVPVTKLGKAFDALFLILAGLSGPFIIFLAPVAFLMYLKNKTGWKSKLFIVSMICATAQWISLVFLSVGSRLYLLPIIDWGLLPEILTRQIFLGSVLGSKGYFWFANILYLSKPSLVITILALSLVGYTCIKATYEHKLFIMFSFIILTASLLSPTTTVSSSDSWKILATNEAGIRYWLIPMLAFVSVLFFNCRTNTPLVLRGIAASFLLVGLFGIALNFRHSSLPDLNFGSYVKAFDNAPQGKKVLIPINPTSFYLKLIKH